MKNYLWDGKPFVTTQGHGFDQCLRESATQRAGLDDPFKPCPAQTKKDEKLRLPRTPELVTALILAAISVLKHLKSFDASVARLLCPHLS